MAAASLESGVGPLTHAPSHSPHDDRDVSLLSPLADHRLLMGSGESSPWEREEFCAPITFPYVLRLGQMPNWPSRSYGTGNTSERSQLLP